MAAVGTAIGRVERGDGGDEKVNAESDDKEEEEKDSACDSVMFVCVLCVCVCEIPALSNVQQPEGVR